MGWVKTRKCGCGDCALKPMSEGPCPLENGHGAKWLWAQESRLNEEEIPEEDLTNALELVPVPVYE